MPPMNTPRRVLVPLADGFEELEAVAIIDILRRAGVEVVVAGLKPGAACGSHAIEIATEVEFAGVDLATIDMLVLPGGQPGSTYLADDLRVIAAVQQLHATARHVAAICAAPTVLARAGILGGVRVTSHPSVRAKLGDAVVVDAPRVVTSGTITTSQGAGTAVEFALALVEQLVDVAKANELRTAMLVGARQA